MKYRDHKGGFAESIATLFEFTALSDLVNHIRARFPLAAYVEIKPYANDSRDGWQNTHIVTAPEYGVLGFTDGPVFRSNT